MAQQQVIVNTELCIAIVVVGTVYTPPLTAFMKTIYHQPFYLMLVLFRLLLSPKPTWKPNKDPTTTVLSKRAYILLAWRRLGVITGYTEGQVA